METSYDNRLLLALVAAIAVVYLLTSPLYGFHVGDQNEQIPPIEHVLDEASLESDWTVTEKTTLGSPRFFYVMLMAGVATVLGVPMAFSVVYGIATLASLGSVFVFTRNLFDDALVGVITTGLFLSPLMRHFHLGFNPLIYTYLTPSHLANALVLVALASLSRCRYVVAYLLLGAATLLSVSVGALMAGLVTLAVIAADANWEPNASTVTTDAHDAGLGGRFTSLVRAVPFRGVFAYAIVAAVGVVPLLVRNATSDVGLEAVRIMAWLRHPHHYVPSTWISVRMAAVVLAIGVAVLVMAVVSDDELFPDERTTRFAWTFIVASILLMFVGGYVFTELYPISTIIKLQPFHVDHFLYVLLFGGVSKIGVQRARSWIPSVTGLSGANAVVVVVIGLWLVGFFVTAGVTGIDTTVVSTPEHDHPDLEETYDWIRANSPRDSRFVIPPNSSQFRLRAERAAVVDFKTFVFTPDGMLEWKERMDAVCGKNLWEVGRGYEVERLCTQRYYDLNESQIEHVARRYDACWVLTRNETYDFPKRYENGDYVVYELRNCTGAADSELAAGRSVAGPAAKVTLV